MQEIIYHNITHTTMARLINEIISFNYLFMNDHLSAAL